MILVRDIGALLDGLLVVRESLEQGSQYSGSSTDLRAVYMSFERVRFPFASLVAEYGKDGHNLLELGQAVNQLRQDIAALLADETFVQICRHMPTSRKPRRREDTSFPLRELQTIGPRTIDLNQFIEMLYGSLEGGLGSQPDLFQASEKASRVEDLINLRRIVPKQKIAPVQFDIVNNIIVVQSTESNIPSDIRRATNAAREELLSRGHDLIEQLKRSNCDRRLLESAAELHTHLQNGKDVVRLGLANIGFSLMGGKFQNELPEAIAALVQAHSVGVSMYVAQFPDWAKFAENASAIEVDKKDAATLSQVLTQVISATEDKKVAEPEVPRTLKHLRSLISDPKAFSARLALAVIRTIENLTIRLFNHGSDFFEKTISQSIDLGAKTTSRVIVGALLAVGMTAAVGLTPMVPKVHGLNWIDDALQIVQRQLSSLKD